MASGDAARQALTSSAELVRGFESLASRRLVLFGGKGGVGKTTLASAAALHLAASRDVVLFATDPASNLAKLFGASEVPRLRIESLDASALYGRFLAANLASFLEIGDRGTYLDPEELRRFFELALPGVDELMAWLRIGELAEEHPDAIVVVDTAPTGHTIRMLGASSQFERLAEALDALAEKHRAIVRQFARRNVRDEIDRFIERFAQQAERRRELLRDASRAAFVPVTLAEPWVVEQTQRLIAELGESGIPTPFVILNRAIRDADCARDRERQRADGEARGRFARVVDAPRSCVPLDSVDALRAYLAPPGRVAATEGQPEAAPPAGAGALVLPRIVFFAGKGGVGKTTCAVSAALQLASRNPGRRYVLMSVDPAHSVRDVFAREPAPANLTVETIDTRAKWSHLRRRLGDEIERAVDALTPGRLNVAYDSEAMKQLLEIGPPGADEIFAVMRLAELIDDGGVDGLIVDTAPTGHFLRLLDLPQTAGEWVRELMRLLLRYRELVSPGALGEELVEASRALRELDAALRSDRAGVVVVTRPETIVVDETRQLIEELRRRAIPIAGLIANYLTPAGDCACDRSMRARETAALGPLPAPTTAIERRDTPVTKLGDLAELLPLA